MKRFFVFVWKSKCDKVKSVVVYQDYLSGALNIVKVDRFIDSVNFYWINKLTKKNNGYM